MSFCNIFQYLLSKIAIISAKNSATSVYPTACYFDIGCLAKFNTVTCLVSSACTSPIKEFKKLAHGPFLDPFAEEVFPSKTLPLNFDLSNILYFRRTPLHRADTQSRIFNSQRVRKNFAKRTSQNRRTGVASRFFPQKHFRARGFAFKKSADNVDKVARLSTSLLVFYILRRIPWGNSIQRDRHS